MSQTRSEDWFVTIDLKDAYFPSPSFPITGSTWGLLWGEAYQYRVFPFGLALSPRTFTKYVDAALAPLWLQGIRILNHINIWLILAQSEQMAVRHRDVVLTHTKELGLRLNARKVCFLQYREPLIWAWCGSRPRCRHVCPLLRSSRSSRQSGEWDKAGHSLSSSSRDCWVWWQLRPTWYLLACCTWDPYSGGSRPRGSPWGETHSAYKVTRRCLRALDMWRKPWFLS